MTSFLGSGPGDIGYFPSGAYWKNNVNLGTGLPYTTGDVLGFAINMVGNLTVFVNNVQAFTIAHGLTGETFPGISDSSTGNICDMIMNFGSDSSFGGRKEAQGNPDTGGNGDFYYSPPSGDFLSIKAP